MMQPSSSTRATIVSAENQNGAAIVEAIFFFCHYDIVWESNNAGESRGESWHEENPDITQEDCVGYLSGTKRKHFAALSASRPCCWRWLQLQPSSLQWRHNGHDSVSNHQSHNCLLNRLFRRRSKKTSKLGVTGLCAGNSPGTGEFPTQMASNAENVSIWWRHHGAVSPREKGWRLSGVDGIERQGIRYYGHFDISGHSFVQFAIWQVFWRNKYLVSVYKPQNTSMIYCHKGPTQTFAFSILFSNTERQIIALNLIPFVKRYIYYFTCDIWSGKSNQFLTSLYLPAQRAQVNISHFSVMKSINTEPLILVQQGPTIVGPLLHDIKRYVLFK